MVNSISTAESDQALLLHFARSGSGLLRSHGAALSACAKAKRWEVREGRIQPSVDEHLNHGGFDHEIWQFPVSHPAPMKA
jgi:hypothetical protein